MLEQLSYEISTFTESSKLYIPLMLKWTVALWIFNIVNWRTGSRLNQLGIHPREGLGLIGIPLAPLLHANFSHLLFNTMPLFFLALFAITLNPPLFYFATAAITLLAGLGVWLAGRSAIHIGASGLIAGYFGYVLASAYQHPTFATFFCAGIALYYFGGILFSLFPTEESISWEGHLAGFLAGLLTMFICTHFKSYIPAHFYHFI